MPRGPRDDLHRDDVELDQQHDHNVDHEHVRDDGAVDHDDYDNLYLDDVAGMLNPWQPLRYHLWRPWILLLPL